MGYLMMMGHLMSISYNDHEEEHMSFVPQNPVSCFEGFRATDFRVHICHSSHSAYDSHRNMMKPNAQYPVRRVTKTMVSDAHVHVLSQNSVHCGVAKRQQDRHGQTEMFPRNVTIS